MLRYLIALFLLFLTSVASASTVVSDGSDGLFNPSGETILTVPSDGIFNFTSIDFSANVDLSFDRAGFSDTIWLAATGNISLSGTITWSGGLGFTTENGNISISANLIGDDLTITGGQGGSIDFDGAITGINFDELPDLTVPDPNNLVIRINPDEIIIDDGTVQLNPLPVPLPASIVLFSFAVGFLFARLKKAHT